MASIEARLRRRLLILQLGAAGVATPVAAQGPKSGYRPPAEPPPSGVSDADPTDPAGRGRGRPGWVSDADPTDPPGQGRGGAPRAPQGATDSDPTDPVGRGRQGRPLEKDA